MKRAKISQREAHQLQRQVARLENQIDQQRMAYASEWPGGVSIGWIEPGLEVFTAVKTARRLGHAVVVVPQSTTHINLFALPLPTEAK